MEDERRQPLSTSTDQLPPDHAFKTTYGQLALWVRNFGGTVGRFTEEIGDPGLTREVHERVITAARHVIEMGGAERTTLEDVDSVTAFQVDVGADFMATVSRELVTPTVNDAKTPTRERPTRPPRRTAVPSLRGDTADNTNVSTPTAAPSVLSSRAEDVPLSDVPDREVVQQPTEKPSAADGPSHDLG